MAVELRARIGSSEPEHGPLLVPYYGLDSG
jgi:hypothetical protein